MKQCNNLESCTEKYLDRKIIKALLQHGSKISMAPFKTASVPTAIVNILKKDIESILWEVNERLQFEMSNSEDSCCLQ